MHSKSAEFYKKLSIIFFLIIGGILMFGLSAHIAHGALGTCKCSNYLGDETPEFASIECGGLDCEQKCTDMDFSFVSCITPSEGICNPSCGEGELGEGPRCIRENPRQCGCIFNSDCESGACASGVCSSSGGGAGGGQSSNNEVTCVCQDFQGAGYVERTLYYVGGCGSGDNDICDFRCKDAGYVGRVQCTETPSSGGGGGTGDVGGMRGVCVCEEGNTGMPQNERTFYIDGGCGSGSSRCDSKCYTDLQVLALSCTDEVAPPSGGGGDGGTGGGGDGGGGGVGGGGGAGSLPNPLGVSTISELFTKIVQFIIALAMPFAVFMVILAGFRFATAQGSEDKINQAKRNFIWTVTGIAVIVASEALISYVGELLGTGGGTLNAFIERIRSTLNLVIAVLFTLVTVYFIWGIIQYVRSGGDETALKQGKQHMVWGIIGMSIMGAAWGIVQIIVDYMR